MDTFPGPDSTCEVTVADSAAGILVVVAGDMDYATVTRVRTAIDAALRRLGQRVLVLDLGEVTFLDSAGIAVLIETLGAAAAASGADRPLRIVVDHDRAVLRPLQISGLDHVLHLFESRDGALRT